jgi:hypothetical protein
MAALAVFEKQAGRKLALGLSLQFVSIIFLIPAFSLPVGPLRVQEAREGLAWTGWFVFAGWLLEQWEAGKWPLQAKIRVLWKTRVGNLVLSLLLAAALTVLSLIAINATLWLLIQ